MEIEECKNYKKKYSKYGIESHFETLFTYEELDEKISNITCDIKKHNKNIPDIIKNTKVYTKLNNPKYLLSDISIKNTLDHFWYRDFGGWLFISILNNKIDKLYSPYNIKFTNNWSHLLKPFNIHKYLKSKYKYFNNNQNIKPFNKFNNNGCLINMIDYNAMPQTYQLEFINMLSELLKHKTIKDTCFIFSTKDFPALSLTGDKWIHPNQEIKIYDSHIPVFSQSTTDNHLDIPVPCDMDWKIVSQKAYPESCDVFNENAIPNINWNDKIEIAFFRGSATGCYFDDRNPRIKVHRLSQKYPDILDAGIIFFANRDKIENGVITHHKMYNNSDIILKKLVPMIEQAKYKYIINIKGNSAAYRLPYLFYLKSVVIIVETKYKLWFENLLVPFEHYIPVKEDLSDLIEKINWLKQNDNKAKEIATNGYNLVKNYIHNKNNIFDYLTYCINSI